MTIKDLLWKESRGTIFEEVARKLVINEQMQDITHRNSQINIIQSLTIFILSIITIVILLGVIPYTIVNIVLKKMDSKGDNSANGAYFVLTLIILAAYLLYIITYIYLLVLVALVSFISLFF